MPIWLLGRSFLAQKWAKWVFSGPKMLFWHKKPRRPYLENETSHRTSAGVKTTGFFRAFQIFRRNRFFGFLYFCISGFLGFYLDFWPYLRNEKSYCRSAGVKTTGIVRAFQIFRRNWTFGFLGFWISVFFGFLALSCERKELHQPNCTQLCKKCCVNIPR